LSLPTPVGVTRAFDTRTVYDIYVVLNRVYDVYIACTFPGVDRIGRVNPGAGHELQCILYTVIHAGLNRDRSGRGILDVWRILRRGVN